MLKSFIKTLAGSLVIVICILTAIHLYFIVSTHSVMEDVEAAMNGPVLTEGWKSCPPLQRHFSPIDNGITVRKMLGAYRYLTILNGSSGKIWIKQHYTYRLNNEDVEYWDVVILHIKKKGGSWTIVDASTYL